MNKLLRVKNLLFIIKSTLLVYYYKIYDKRIINTKIILNLYVFILLYCGKYIIYITICFN